MKTLNLSTGEVNPWNTESPAETEEPTTEKQHENSEFYGVMLPVSRIKEKLIEVFQERRPSEVSAWGLYDQLLDIVRAETQEDLSSMAQCSFKLLVYEFLKDIAIGEDDAEEKFATHDLINSISRICDNQVTYNNPTAGFYLDNLAYDRGFKAWPVVSVNSEGFHNCIGLITQNGNTYTAIPFIKEIAHVSPNKMINDVLESNWEPRIDGISAIREILSVNDDQDDRSPDFHQAPHGIRISLAKYLYGTSIATIMQNLENKNYCESEVIAVNCTDKLSRSLFITEDLMNQDLTYPQIFKILADRTIDLGNNCDGDPDKLIAELDSGTYKIKKYNDMSLAMTDVINITQVGMKATQKKETADFLKDFLDI